MAKDSREIEKEIEFSWGEPMASPPMEGLEKFTIIPLKNPIQTQSGTDIRTASLLFEKMARMLEQKQAQAKLAVQSNTVRASIEPRMVAQTDQYGAVTMQMQMVSVTENIEETAQMLVDEIWRICGQDAGMGLRILDRFWTRIGQNYAQEEIMSTLLICAEEEFSFERKKPKVIENRPTYFGFSRLEFLTRIERNNKQKEREVKIRLVSVREMLKYYFFMHPQEYKSSILAVLGSSYENMPRGMLEQLIEAEIERIGVWEFAVLVWEKIQEKIRMRKFGSQKLTPAERGVLALNGGQEWLVCPRWNREWSKDAASEIAKIIYESMRAK
ncbi:MAG: hypothetical protein WC492_05085 [Candidatus Micrarchaeia archaeon]